MFKIFLDGLFFGAGFSIAFIVILALAFWFMHPWHYMYRMHDFPGHDYPRQVPQTVPAPVPGVMGSVAPFRPQSLARVEGRIEKSGMTGAAHFHLHKMEKI